MTDVLGNIFDSMEEGELDVETDIPGADYQPIPNFEDIPPEPERRPNTRIKPSSRASGSDIISLVWGGAGAFLVRQRLDIPAGRVLQLEAPAAGAKIDELLAGTWLDSLLQPIFKSADKWEEFGALIAFPVLTSMYWRKEELRPMIDPFLGEMALTIMGEVATQQRAKTRKARGNARTMASISEVFQVPKGQDPVVFMMNGIFDMSQEGAPSEASEG
jgi:hypothetical protein